MLLAPEHLEIFQAWIHFTGILLFILCGQCHAEMFCTFWLLYSFKESGHSPLTSFINIVFLATKLSLTGCFLFRSGIFHRLSIL